MAVENQEELVLALVVMPDELAFDLRELHVLAVELTDDPRTPPFRELLELLREVHLVDLAIAHARPPNGLAFNLRAVMRRPFRCQYSIVPSLVPTSAASWQDFRVKPVLLADGVGTRQWGLAIMEDRSMAKKYVVMLTLDEREQLQQLVSVGKSAAIKIRRANVLLKADQGEHAAGWTDQQISEAFDVTTRSIEMLRQRAVEEGPMAVVEGRRNRQPRTPPKFDGESEAPLIALACSQPPAGRSRWSLRLLADRLVQLEVFESVSYETVRQVLKKTN